MESCVLSVRESCIRLLANALIGIALMVGGARVTLGTPPHDPYQAPFEKMSGAQLVKQLLDPASISRAFYELHRRADVARHKEGWDAVPDEGYELFLTGRHGAAVKVCPQAGGSPPLYMVTYSGFPLMLGLRRDEPADYPVPRREELFPPVAEPPQRPPDASPYGFEIFDSEGAALILFMPSWERGDANGFCGSTRRIPTSSRGNPSAGRKSLQAARSSSSAPLRERLSAIAAAIPSSAVLRATIKAALRGK